VFLLQRAFLQDDKSRMPHFAKGVLRFAQGMDFSSDACCLVSILVGDLLAACPLAYPAYDDSIVLFYIIYI
jgi:hypothetical protein